jgi:hypothetical protein
LVEPYGVMSAQPRSSARMKTTFGRFAGSAANAVADKSSTAIAATRRCMGFLSFRQAERLTRVRIVYL